MCVDARMAKGEGKGWAKGKSAANDARVAKNADAHRGREYVRRKPLEDCRWPIRTTTTLALQWSDAMAYIVGLTATDGCLFTGFRKINFKSADRELVVTYLELLGRSNPVKTVRTRRGGLVHLTQFGDARFYRWLLGIGLTPRKSLTLGGIAVPDAFLAPLMRGLLDGDGSLENFVHHPTPTTYPDYVYERLWLYFNSASRAHIDWLEQRTRALFNVAGYIETRPATETRHALYRLKFGKYDSITLLRAMYPRDDVPMLRRKWAIWAEYARRNGISPV